MGSGEEGSILEKRFNILFSRVKMLHLGGDQKYKKCEEKNTTKWSTLYFQVKILIFWTLWNEVTTKQ